MSEQSPSGSWTIQGRTLTFPVPIAAASCFGGVFLCSARAAEKVLADTGLRPLRIAGRTPVVVLAVRYHDVPGNVLGDYNELGLVFLVRAADRSVRGHVHQLPVSQDFTREAGQRLWGFPKWVADISVVTHRRGGRVSLRLLDQDADSPPVVRMETAVRRGTRLPDIVKPTRLAVHQFRDGRPGLIEAAATAKGVRFGPGGTTVVPGRGHALADELVVLGFPRVRAVASFTVDLMAAELDDFVPLSEAVPRPQPGPSPTPGTASSGPVADRPSTRPVALVTGAASGIGLAATRRLTERGYAVAAIDVNQEALDALEAELPGTVTAYLADVRDLGSLRAAVDTVERDLGPIEHVLSSAGVARVGPALQADRADEAQMMDVNYGGVVNLVHACLPRMLERGSGEFAVIASLTGLVPPKKMAGYGASKAATISYLQSLRQEHAGKGVTIACVCPAAVKTPMALDFFADPAKRSRSMAMDPEHVVRAIEDGLAAGTFMIYPGIARPIALLNRVAPSVLRTLQRGRLDLVD